MEPGRILCIDDEESVLITIQAVLEEDGHVVDTAHRTADGLELLRKAPYDLVLTDLRIDERDGMDVLRTVKEIDAELIVILLTGYASLQSAIQALRAGAYDYLIKPCDVNELKLTIARGLEKRGLALALKERVAELEEANARIAGFAGELQEKVQAATAQLETQVREIELANAELTRLYAIEQQQTARLQELNERKSSFLSMVAHELRTPLTGLRGFTELFRMRFGALDERQERIIMLITQQVERLSGLVNELLSLTNIEQHGIVLRRAPADLAECLANVVERFSLIYPQRTITLAQKMECCVGMWDCDRLEQVFSNLIGNAIKYSPPDTPVTITLSKSAEMGIAGEAVRISVADQGIGIPADEQAELFAKFYRARNAEAYQSGLGLGLFISNEIVRRHGGWIEVSSEEGRGSTFSVILPMSDPATEDVADVADRAEQTAA
jgi:signal transduction histidine kinase